MISYELTNDQRKYFGLAQVADNWNRKLLSNTVTVYFNDNRIVKILIFNSGYLEYDTDIATKGREILLPKTAKGKEQKLTIPKILKIKGSGIQFSGSFQGGGIHVYDNKRNSFFIKSFSEEGEIKSYQDINKWISNYIAKVPTNYFDWLNNELNQKQLKITITEGDIIGFKIGHYEYGFARILLDVFAEKKKGDIIRPELYWVHPRSLIIAPYAYYGDTLKINIDNLVNKKTFPSLCIFDHSVYYGEMPVVGHRPLSEIDKQIPFPKNTETFITIPYTKTDIENMQFTSSE